MFRSSINATNTYEQLNDLKRVLQEQLLASRKQYQQCREAQSDGEQRSIEKGARWNNLLKDIHQMAICVQDLREIRSAPVTGKSR